MTEFITSAFRWTLFSTLISAPAAIANPNYLSLSLEQLLQIKIHSVSKKVESINDAPAAIYAVTHADIQRSGVTTIPDALRMVPGVEVAQADANTWAISIRGFNSALSNKLLVLLDGRTIYNPVFGGVLWEAHHLMLEDIERIEVIRGPGGALWGANAVNGVINIITKHARESQGNLLSTLYGNEEQGTLSARHGGRIGDEGFYRVYAKGFKHDQSYKPNMPLGNSTDTYDEWDGFRGGFRMDWKDQLTLQGDAYRTNTHQLRTNYSLVAPFSHVEQQQLVYEGANLLARWVEQRSDGSRLRLQTYLDWTKRDEPFNFVDERIRFDMEAQVDFAPSARQEIIAGIGLRHVDEDKQGTSNVHFSPAKDRRNLYSVFIQDKLTLVPQSWYLTLGTKVEHNEFSGVEVQPNLRLQWLVNQQQSFWAAISRAVRTPTPIETELTSTIATAEAIRVAFVPNGEYESEELTAYELGYRHQLTPAVSVDTTIFYNDYERLSTFSLHDPELIINTIDPPHFLVPVTFTNNMGGHSSGFEAVLDWRAKETLQITASYSYLDLKLKALDPSQEGAERLSPEHQVSGRIFWDFLPDWTLGMTSTYVDKLSGGDVDDYLRVDINLGRKISQSVAVNLVGQNLLDARHREFGSLEDLNVGEIERSIFAKLTLMF